MSVFKLVSEQRVKGKVKKVFDDIKRTRNIKKIPNFWRAIANNPETLERTWNNLKQIMKKGELEALRVSATSGKVVRGTNEATKAIER